MTLESAIKECTKYPMTEAGYVALTTSCKDTDNEEQLNSIALNLREATYLFDGKSWSDELHRRTFRGHKQFSATPKEAFNPEREEHPIKIALRKANECHFSAKEEELRNILITNIHSYTIALVKTYIGEVISILKNKNLNEEIIQAQNHPQLSHLIAIDFDQFQNFYALFTNLFKLQLGDRESIREFISNNMGLDELVTAAAAKELAKLYSQIDKIQDTYVSNSLNHLQSFVKTFTVDSTQQRPGWDIMLKTHMEQLMIDDPAKASFIQLPPNPVYELTMEILTILSDPSQRHNENKLQDAVTRIGHLTQQHKAIGQHLNKLLSDYRQIALENYIEFASLQLNNFNLALSPYGTFFPNYREPDRCLIDTDPKYTYLAAFMTELKTPSDSGLAWLKTCRGRIKIPTLNDKLDEAVKGYQEKQRLSEERRDSAQSAEDAMRMRQATISTGYSAPVAPTIEDQCKTKQREIANSLNHFKQSVTQPQDGQASVYRYTVFFLCFSFTLPQWLCSKRPKGVSELEQTFGKADCKFTAATSLTTFKTIIETLQAVINQVPETCRTYCLFGGTRSEDTQTLYGELKNTLQETINQINPLITEQRELGRYSRRPGGYS